MKEKTVYYSDLLNDDFAGTNINTKDLPDDYCYFPKTAIRRGFACGLYHAAGPLVWLLQKIVYGEKTIDYGWTEIGPALKKLYDRMTGIQYAEFPDTHNWLVEC